MAEAVHQGVAQYVSPPNCAQTWPLQSVSPTHAVHDPPAESPPPVPSSVAPESEGSAVVVLPQPTVSKKAARRVIDFMTAHCVPCPRISGRVRRRLIEKIGARGAPPRLLHAAGPRRRAPRSQRQTPMEVPVVLTAVHVLFGGQSDGCSQATYRVSVNLPASTVPVHWADGMQVVALKPLVFW